MMGHGNASRSMAQGKLTSAPLGVETGAARPFLVLRPLDAVAARTVFRLTQPRLPGREAKRAPGHAANRRTVRLRPPPLARGSTPDPGFIPGCRAAARPPRHLTH
jgi:hypothetical protein